MIYPHKVQMAFSGSQELEPLDLPDWAIGQELSWTISSGLGTLLDIGSDRVRFTGPAAGVGVPDQTVIHLYALDQVVGECTVNLAAVPPRLWRPASPDLPPNQNQNHPPKTKTSKSPSTVVKTPQIPANPL